MSDPYFKREQTKAKHFILKRYLEKLAFKVLTFQDITYVDGFSGPWQTRTENFSDTSFMIALEVLRNAQQGVFERRGIRRRIRCFFSEKNPEAFLKLQAAVTPYNRPNDCFEVKTCHSTFEDAVPEIQAFIGSSFPLIFIDPTGWTGYPFDKIRPLFRRSKCEVLINFMYDYVNRFANSDAEEIITSLDPILGGPGWRGRLDKSLSRGAAVEKLFRETLSAEGRFDFVVSTKIDKATEERPHFFIAYGTKSSEGLKTFRNIEYDALREHEKSRAKARARKREEKFGIADMFGSEDVQLQEMTIDEVIYRQMDLASSYLVDLLSRNGSLKFSSVVVQLLQPFMLRETNVKDLCVDLAKAGRIENTWGGGNRKPRESDWIRLATSVPSNPE